MNNLAFSKPDQWGISYFLAIKIRVCGWLRTMWQTMFYLTIKKEQRN